MHRDDGTGRRNCRHHELRHPKKSYQKCTQQQQNMTRTTTPINNNSNNNIGINYCQDGGSMGAALLLPVVLIIPGFMSSGLEIVVESTLKPTWKSQRVWLNLSSLGLSVGNSTTTITTNNNNHSNNNSERYHNNQPQVRMTNRQRSYGTSRHGSNTRDWIQGIGRRRGNNQNTRPVGSSCCVIRSGPKGRIISCPKGSRMD